MNIRLLLIFFFTHCVCLSTVFSQDNEIRKIIFTLEKTLSTTKNVNKKIDLLNELSRFETQEGECKLAIEHALEAEKLARKNNEVKQITSAYVSLSAAYRDCRDEKKFFHYVTKSLERLKDSYNPTDEAYVYFQLGIFHADKKENEKAKEYLQKGIALSDKTEDALLKGNLQGFIAKFYSDQALYIEAAKHFNKALAFYKKTTWVSKMAWTSGNVGLLNYWQGNRVLAFKHYTYALDKYWQINDTIGVIWIAGQLGNLHRSMKEFNKAAEYFDQVLTLNKKLGRKLEEGDSYLLLAGLYSEMNELDRSNNLLEKANRIFSTENDSIGLHGYWGQLSANYFEAKKYDQALEVLFKHIELSKKIGADRKRVHSEKLVGAIYILTGRVREGEEILKRTLQFFEEREEERSYPFVFKYLVSADSIKGDYQAAFAHYKDLIKYKEKTKGTQDDTEKLAIRYEFEKKEAVAKAELKTKQMQRNVAMLGCAVAILMLMIVFFLFRLRNKRIKVEKENIALSKREMERIVEMEQFKVRFLANISHEFRTPLTLINGHIEVLEENGSGEEQMRFQEMKNSGKQLLQLINQLLELSKMENTAYALHYKTGFILKETKAFVEAFHSLAEQKHIDLSFHQETEQHEAFVFSQEALSTVVSNLLSNAFKFTPDGGEISVSVAVKNDVFVLKVKDSGVGIDAAHLPHVFDRFYQIDEPQNRSFEGSGIGLALVKELAILHGGTVTVTSSEEEGGTTFYVYLKSGIVSESFHEEMKVPVVVVENEQKIIEQNEELPLVLVVEDQNELRRFIRDNLGEEYRFAEAKNGTEGIQMAEELVPDLIISDIMMPDTNGLILCKTLKENVATSHIPIMLLTAKADQLDKIEGLENGADDYLVKPFSLVELKLRVRNVMRTRQLLRQKFEGVIIPTPDELPELPLKDKAFLININEKIQAHLSDQQFGVPELAENLFFSVSKLSRKMKSLTGTTPADYIRNMRLQKAVDLLKEGWNVAEAGWEVGFEDPVYFSKVFKKRFGYPPSHVHKSDNK